MRKKVILLAAVLGSCALALLCWCWLGQGEPQPTGQELLTNPALERSAESEALPGWYTEAYWQGASAFSVEPGAGPQGQAALHILNDQLNDARFAQTVPVEPDSLYCLSGWICADVREGRGANLSVEGVYAFSPPLYDTAGQWERVELYGRTGPEQHTLTVFARLGGYSGESEGEAWFAELSLKKMAQEPAEAVVYPLYSAAPAAAQHAVQLDLRHGLLVFFALLYGWMVWRCLRGRSLLGLAVLALATGALSIFLSMRELTEPVELAGRYLLFAAHLATLALTVWQGCLLAKQGTPLQGFAPAPPESAGSRGGRQRMAGRDWGWMLAITALYAVLAYTNLGSMTSPQTAYVFQSPNERVVFDLGEQRADFRMLYMGGVHQSSSPFTVQTSDNGEDWRAPIVCEMQPGGLFQWTYVQGAAAPDPRVLSGRYVRLTPKYRGLTLQEVVFRDAAGQVLPVTAAHAQGEDVSALVDEGETLQGEPSWYNSIYFDEIYHVRTAYEHLHGMAPYEISHPPLGKVIMSWCIGLLGMTPFGWRFAGATCGVLMLPAMYLLGRLLFDKRRYALLSCLLLALDTLHFTQTRIATIDSFVVLFILWAVYFMFRWFYADSCGAGWRRSLIPLGLSGLFMGLAVASKWPGCFAGLGLAAVFFYGIWRKWRAVRQTTETAAGKKRLLLTVASCLIFFVLVPAIVYYCAYIPHFAPTGGVTLARIWDAAEYMLGYHSQQNLGTDHLFYAPWYTWPLSQIPMYYAAPRYTPPGMTYAIFAMGNYAVWWVGLLTLCMTVLAWAKHQCVPVLCGDYGRAVYPLAPAGERDERPALLLLTFAAQFIPWVLVPRGTYIYHYFPSLPFVVLCTAYVLDRLNDWLVSRSRHVLRTDRLFRGGIAVYLALVLGMFVAFYPIASGLLVPRAWMDAINWFGKLYY